MSGASSFEPDREPNVAESGRRDALQPALLDRLRDDAPQRETEGREERVITSWKLRSYVLRDLGWLFNVTAPSPDEFRLDEWRYVSETVLNFGLPALAGKLVSGLDLSGLEQAMRDAILAFEPRILPNTLRVRGYPVEDPYGHHNVISLEISGDLWALPYPLELLIKTDLDLESGEVRLSEGG